MERVLKILNSEMIKVTIRRDAPRLNGFIQLEVRATHYMDNLCWSVRIGLLSGSPTPQSVRNQRHLARVI